MYRSLFSFISQQSVKTYSMLFVQYVNLARTKLALLCENDPKFTH